MQHHVDAEILPYWKWATYSNIPLIHYSPISIIKISSNAEWQINKKKTNANFSKEKYQ